MLYAGSTTLGNLSHVVMDEVHYLADRFRNAQVVGVSNSHSQRRYIMGQAQERGLTNLQIVTLDLS